MGLQHVHSPPAALLSPPPAIVRTATVTPALPTVTRVFSVARQVQGLLLFPSGMPKSKTRAKTMLAQEARALWYPAFRDHVKDTLMAAGGVGAIVQNPELARTWASEVMRPDFVGPLQSVQVKKALHQSLARRDHVHWQKLVFPLSQTAEYTPSPWTRAGRRPRQGPPAE